MATRSLCQFIRLFIAAFAHKVRLGRGGRKQKQGEKAGLAVFHHDGRGGRGLVFHGGPEIAR
jgi:hypothetical protein